MYASAPRRTEVPTGIVDASADEIRYTLELLLLGPKFKQSPALSAMLRYVVEQTLVGEGKRLKAYTVAVEALGRPCNFDPGIDPIVRVNAMRLRASLAEQYNEADADYPIVITLPKGRYEPVFYRSRPTHNDNSAVKMHSRIVREGTTLCLSNSSPSDAGPEESDFRRTLHKALTRFGQISVVEQENADFTLSLDCTTSPQSDLTGYHFGVTENLSSNSIWQGADGFAVDRPMAATVANICAAVVGHSGCIHRANIAAYLSGQQFDERYRTKLLFIDALRSYDCAEHQTETEAMIEDHVAKDPGFSYGFSFLAQLLARRSLLKTPHEEAEGLLNRAWRLAGRATELSPQNSFAYATLFWLSSLRKESAIAEAALRTALMLNPYDNDIVLMRGASLVANGEPSRGVADIERCLSFDLAQPVHHFFYACIGRYLIGDLDGARRYAMLLPADLSSGWQSYPGAFLARALVAAASGHAGQSAELLDALYQNLQMDPHDLATFVTRFVKHESSATEIMRTLVLT